MDEIDYQFAEDDFPEKIVEKLRVTFREEAYELLAELENALLALEENPGDRDLVNRVFRALHTIKGSGGACGFDSISRFAHEVETFYDFVRNGQLAVTKQIIDLTLMARDQIQALFDEFYNHRPADASKTGRIISRFGELMPGSLPAGSRERREQAAAPSPGQATYRIRFRPGLDFLSYGMDPVSFLDELRGLGPCTVVAQTEAIPYLEDFNPEHWYTYWDAILTTDRGRDAIEDIFIFAKSVCELTVEVIDAYGCTDCDETTYKRLGDILLERGDLSAEDLQNALRSKKRLGETLVETGAVPPGKVESALAEQQHVREIREERRMNEETSSIRVSTAKLDDLVNLVGELVTVRARLSQLAFTQNSPQLLSVAEEVERLTGDLRDKTMSIRMLPIGTIFGKFQRLVRDLSSDLGKEVELVAEGAETELDKTVIERLGDPLVHLIRNCIDHGIEKPTKRERTGKARRGTVRLSAAHSGAHVLIRIEDDGKGLDAHAVRAKAVERGLIAPDAAMSEQDLYALVFSPGFSTAKTVTGVSGRGVGLDVVKKAIEALRGSIELQSKRGEGASITLKLPLTLAIIDGLLVRIGPERFVIPLALVKECVELSRQDRRNGHGRNIANVRGAILPYVDLRDRFGISGDRPPIEQIVVTEPGGARTGLVVDGVIGGHQTVIKNLGTFYRDVEGVSGATILGDGTVALILDVPKLVQGAEREEADIVASIRDPQH